MVLTQQSNLNVSGDKTHKMIIKCQYCHNNFRIFSYRKGIAKYCSRRCVDLSKKGKKNHLIKYTIKGICLNTGKTHFGKGFTPWNKNTKGLIKSNSGSFKKGQVPWNKNLKNKENCPMCNKEFLTNEKGRRHKTCSTICKIQAIKNARAKQIITQEHRKAISESTKGRKLTKEHIAKISGSNNYHWKGGSDNPIKKLRGSFEYKKWRMEVYRRDYWTCQICRIKGKKIWADHIKPFSLFPEFRFDINNGRTLCIDCALKLPTHGSRIYNYQNTIGIN